MEESSPLTVRIGIDARFAGEDVGLGRYTRELSTRLPTALPDVQFVFFVRSAQESWLSSIDRSRVELLPAPFSPYSFDEQTKFPVLLHRSRLHLLFAPHFNVPYLCPVPTVLTVHDLILHRYPNGASFFKMLAYKLLFRRAVRHARKIICVSSFTQSELSHHEGEPCAAKSEVIPEAPSAVFSRRDASVSDAVLRKFGISGSYYLYVGNAKEHKNLPLLFRAHRSLPLDAPQLVMVCGGREADALELPPRVVRLPSVTDEELASLYTRAAAFVSPSLVEGFGLPVVEAQSCGCPVVAVRAGSIPEVASKEALLVEPDASSFASAMKEVLGLPRPEPSQALTWDHIARRAAHVLTSSLVHHG